MDQVQQVSQGLSFTPGGTTVTVDTGGTYSIHYSILAEEVDGVNFHLLINGAVLAGSAIEAIQGSGDAIVTLPAGSTVAIGTNGGDLTLIEGTNAFLTLIRLAD